MAQTILHILYEVSKKHPETVALQEDGFSLSYGELPQVVLEVAASLQDRGLSAGDRFAVWAPNCSEWVIMTLAAQALGAVLVPLNTRYTGFEAGDILRRSKCRFLFTVKGFLKSDYESMLSDEDLPDLKEILIIRDFKTGDDCLSKIKRPDCPAISPDIIESISPNALSDIMYTSGTTGKPKGVMTNHGQNIAVFEEFTKAIELKAGDRYLIVNPFFHSFGYKAGWLSCLIRGATIYPLALFEPEDALKRIERDKITVMPGAPTIFQMLLSHEALNTTDISSLRVATTGAAVIPVDLIRRMHEELGIDYVYSAYGLTESVGIISLCGKGDSFETIATTCGKALPNTEIKIIDEAGKTLAIGEQGEICTRGFNVMQGYLDDEAATKETITEDGWLKTGDVGIIDKAGYLKITDRKKDMIIVGGFNCYAAEVEQCLMLHESVVDAAVVGRPDERLGEVPYAFVVYKGPTDENTEQEIINWTKTRLANFKVPRAIEFINELPRNASGKVQKFML